MAAVPLDIRPDDGSKAGYIYAGVSTTFSFLALWLSAVALSRWETPGRGAFNLWNKAVVLIGIGIVVRVVVRLLGWGAGCFDSAAPYA
jgi:hypothetical protein